MNTTNNNKHHNRRRVLLLLALVALVGVVVLSVVWYKTGFQNQVEPTAAPTSTPSSSTSLPASTDPLLIPTQPTAESSEVWLVWAPIRATIVLDGDVIKPRLTDNGAVLKITPGTHTFTFSLDGFKDFSRTITVESGDSAPVFVALEPNSPSTKHFYDEQSEDSNTRDWIGGAYMDLSAVIKYLPFQGEGFRIEVKDFHDFYNYYLLVTCDLSVTTHATCKENAKKAMESTSNNGLGLTPVDYYIIYQDKNG
jgi:hypothetical protein